MNTEETVENGEPGETEKRRGWEHVRRRRGSFGNRRWLHALQLRLPFDFQLNREDEEEEISNCKR